MADEAIVLAGGFGTRLRSVVGEVPKPLAPVAGRPFLAWLLDRLAEAGMTHVVLATGYLAEQVESTLGEEWKGMALSHSVEPEPLGTGGAITLARARLRGTAAHVLNGDTWLRYSPAALAALVQAHGAGIGVALAQVPEVGRYGSVRLEGERILGFDEKGGSGPGHINAGCYYLAPDVLAGLPGGRYSFETDILAPLAAAGRIVGLKGGEGFIDIGVPEDYARAQILFGAG
ncbi:nucleotidyltransferase family protein [Pseudoxanthomonas mexicana]|uniref:nucleotidyltransferase family protein n=1 Tax=Pseudoxanthomonas mexicana TaxID=128785 RepID=UPI00398B14E8